MTKSTGAYAPPGKPVKPKPRKMTYQQAFNKLQKLTPEGSCCSADITWWKLDSEYITKKYTLYIENLGGTITASSWEEAFEELEKRLKLSTFPKTSTIQRR